MSSGEAAPTTGRESATDLRLDPLNPRLAPNWASHLGDDAWLRERLTPDFQTLLAQELLDRHDPLPIARSMATYGFFRSDPLLAYRFEDALVVVEGNRRLLALQILIDPELRESLKLSGDWRDLIRNVVVPSEDLSKPWVQRVTSRADAFPVIGVRHIVGIEKWGAYEKAAFVASLARQLGNDRGIADLSTLTGEGAPRIRRYIRDFTFVQQAREDGIDTTPIEKEFSVLGLMLRSRVIRGYLDVASANDVDPSTTRVYSASREVLNPVLSIVFGDSEHNAAIESRHLSGFARILKSDTARQHLFRSRSYPSALALVGGPIENLLQALRSAAGNISQAENLVGEGAHITEEVRAAHEAVQTALQSFAQRVDSVTPDQAVDANQEYYLDADDDTAADDDAPGADAEDAAYEASDDASEAESDGDSDDEEAEAGDGSAETTSNA